MKLIYFIFAMVLLVTMAQAEEIRKLTVSGSGILYKAPDTLTLTIGVESYGKNVKQEIQNNSAKMNAVMEALVIGGLTEKEIQTKEFTITPQMTPAPKNPPQDWEPTIAGYKVHNALEIRTQKIQLAGELIDTIVKQGSNLIENVSFTLQTEEPSKTEAMLKAFHQGETYAKAVASEAGVKLKKIHELSINQLYVNPVAFKASRLMQQKRRLLFLLRTLK